MSSAIPGAVANFVAIMEAALPSDVQIWFGEELGQFVAPQTLQIMEVVGDQQPAEMSPEYKKEETFAIQCSLVSFAGDQSSEAYLARLTEVQALFKIIENTLAQNPSMSTSSPPPPSYDANSAVRLAELGSFSLLPKPAQNNGSSMTWNFSVHCSARIDPFT